MTHPAITALTERACLLRIQLEADRAVDGLGPGRAVLYVPLDVWRFAGLPIKSKLKHFIAYVVAHTGERVPVHVDSMYETFSYGMRTGGEAVMP